MVTVSFYTLVAFHAEDKMAAIPGRCDFDSRRVVDGFFLVYGVTGSMELNAPYTNLAGHRRPRLIPPVPARFVVWCEVWSGLV